MLISILIPVFNEEKTIENILKKVNDLDIWRNYQSIKKEINIDIGIAKPTNKAFLKPRKKVKTVTTKIIPNKILLIKSFT